ncbi:hypothetical protein FA95DRAFT_1567762 [Auriscalpium vulgare]|uniref:Uncharacterized protein n=1 Tax=Auriscalpium vulgare TaxID=40419 RepID=A0ACB8R3A4_9AGAM|nr:hypothetical protein FA95DRAFT_1567762 [Auriscalpium vulgare]
MYKILSELPSPSPSQCSQGFVRGRVEAEAILTGTTDCIASRWVRANLVGEFSSVPNNGGAGTVDPTTEWEPADARDRRGWRAEGSHGADLWQNEKGDNSSSYHDEASRLRTARARSRGPCNRRLAPGGVARGGSGTTRGLKRNWPRYHSS